MGKPLIYWAAPLHDKQDQDRNLKYVTLLRFHGYKVYLPQEHGIWENFSDRQAARRHLFKLDMKAMSQADICIACFGDRDHKRAPSEGGIYEMGWMKGANKTVYLFNDEGYWEFNLMPEFGADEVFTDFDTLLKRLESEQFR